MLITQAFGLDGLGLYVLAYSMLLLCNMVHSAFVSMPISTRLTRQAPAIDTVDDDSYYAMSHLVVVTGVFLVSILAYFVAGWMQILAEIHDFFAKVMLCIPCLLTFNYLRAIFLSDFDYGSVVRMDLSFSALAISLLWVVVRMM